MINVRNGTEKAPVNSLAGNRGGGNVIGLYIVILNLEGRKKRKGQKVVNISWQW